MLTYSAIDDLNADNVGGIPGVIYFAAQEDIEVFSKFTDFDAITTLGSGGILAPVPEMKTGKQFFPMEINIEKGSFECEEVGEIGGKSIKAKLTFNLNKVNDKIADMFRRSNNGKFAFLVPDLNKADQYYAMGLEEYRPAFREAGKIGTGEGAAGKRGAEMTFVCYSVTIPLIEILAAELAVLLAPAT